MAAKMKEDSHSFHPIQRLGAESYKKLVSLCENPGKPTHGLKVLMGGATRASEKSSSNIKK